MECDNKKWDQYFIANFLFWAFSHDIFTIIYFESRTFHLEVKNCVPTKSKIKFAAIGYKFHPT